MIVFIIITIISIIIVIAADEWQSVTAKIYKIRTAHQTNAPRNPGAKARYIMVNFMPNLVARVCSVWDLRFGFMGLGATVIFTGHIGWSALNSTNACRIAVLSLDSCGPCWHRALIILNIRKAENTSPKPPNLKPVHLSLASSWLPDMCVRLRFGSV